MDELAELKGLLHQPLEDEYLPEIKELFLSILRRDLLENIGPSFWESISSHEDKGDVSTFIAATDLLFSKLQPYMDIADHLSEKREPFEEMKPNDDEASFRDEVQIIIRALLLHRTSSNFQSCIRGFYLKAFWSFHEDEPSNSVASNKSDVKMEVTMEEEEDGVDWETKNEEEKDRSVQNMTEHFHRINKKLFSAGLLERVCGEAVTSIINDRIEQFVEERCKGEFEQSFITDLEEWLSTQVMEWLRIIFDSERTRSSSGDVTARTLLKWKERLTYFLYQTYAKLRIRELFNIIVEYPDSQPALEDLKECLGKTDLRAHLIQSLRVATETRLLHPGVNTSDILTQYVSSIRALQVLDSTGVILELVCEPVRSYLRTREDTVRCIVSSLTDEGNSDLADELARSNPLNIHEDQGAEDPEDEGDPFKWEPDPVDADPGHKLSSQRSSDILSMLVNIYGSRELFVNEYRSLLADRILTNFNFDTDREVRNLELLKLRFGETQLHHCEVMLKDVADSRRCNANIKGGKGGKKEGPENKENMEEEGSREVVGTVEAGDETDGEKKENVDLKAMILSAQFWPNLKEEKLSLHSSIQAQLDKYTKSYEALKATRTLFWKPHLGQVTLDLELKDRTLSLSVSPLQATIIMHFEEKDQWTIQELSAVMQVSCTTLRRKIAYWQSQGLLKEDPVDCFTLVEEDSGRGTKEADEVLIDSDDDVETTTSSSQSQTLTVFWSYIEGMLTNLDNLPFERIHSMLKMFAMTGPSTSEIAEHELKQFLDKKVKEQALIYSGGVYKLPKPDD